MKNPGITQNCQNIFESYMTKKENQYQYEVFLKNIDGKIH